MKHKEALETVATLTEAAKTESLNKEQSYALAVSQAYLQHAEDVMGDMLNQAEAARSKLFTETERAAGKESMMGIIDLVVSNHDRNAALGSAELTKHTSGPRRILNEVIKDINRLFIPKENIVATSPPAPPPRIADSLPPLEKKPQKDPARVEKKPPVLSEAHAAQRDKTIERLVTMAESKRGKEFNTEERASIKESLKELRGVLVTASRLFADNSPSPEWATKDRELVNFTVDGLTKDFPLKSKMALTAMTDTDTAAQLPLSTQEPIKQAEKLSADDYKSKFLEKHTEIFNEDKKGLFGSYKNTELKETDSLSDIIQHARAKDNRSREAFVALGWMDKKGNIINNDLAEAAKETSEPEDAPQSQL
jgi:hypothetical protein